MDCNGQRCLQLVQSTRMQVTEQPFNCNCCCGCYDRHFIIYIVMIARIQWERFVHFLRSAAELTDIHVHNSHELLTWWRWDLRCSMVFLCAPVLPPNCHFQWRWSITHITQACLDVEHFHAASLHSPTSPLSTASNGFYHLLAMTENTNINYIDILFMLGNRSFISNI